MANPKKHNLGVFAAGEIPFPLQHTYKDAQSVAIDMTGWSVSTTAEGPDESGSYGSGAVVFTNEAGGEVEYTWVAADFQDVGKYNMLIWAEDGTNRLASDLFVWEVYDGPGATP